MGAARNSLTLAFVAGIFTAPNYMEAFGRRMCEACAAAGFRVREARFVFPYGDWTAGKLKQAAEAAADVLLPAFGGRRAAAEMAAPAEAGEELALVGHSGGGVAALHAAAALRRRGAAVRAVVMIGSPKTPVPPELKSRTAFFYAAGPGGRCRDPVCLLGSFRGRPPACRTPLVLAGGHRDYFRTAAPFIAPSGQPNLEVTARAALDRILGAPAPGT